jgi:hypothetical protein
MKLLCKLVLLVLAAKFLASPPKAGNGLANQVGSLTLHDVACSINAAWTNVETWASGVWTSQTAPAKTGGHRASGGHHPAD